jgi:hypothetical protein
MRVAACGGLDYEKPQSAYGLCTVFLRHIFTVAGNAPHFPYRNRKNVAYSRTLGEVKTATKHLPWTAGVLFFLLLFCQFSLNDFFFVPHGCGTFFKNFQFLFLLTISI